MRVCMLLIKVGDRSKGLLSLEYHLLVLGKPSNYWSVTVWHKKGGKTADLSMQGLKQAGVKIEWGKSTTSAVLGAVLFQADKDNQIAARGSLGEARWATASVMKGVIFSDTAGSGWTSGTTALGSTRLSLNTNDPPLRVMLRIHYLLRQLETKVSSRQC